MAAALCLYFQLHQPWRLQRLTFFDLGKGRPLFDDKQNQAILQRVSERCYLPTTQRLLHLVEQSDLRLTLSLSGSLLDQLRLWQPRVLESLQQLVATGRVELLGETYHHSLASQHSREEFAEQVSMHRLIIERLFDQRPVFFRNTELLYSDAIAQAAADQGYEGVLAEGTDDLLPEPPPRHMYQTASGGKLLLRNYMLSDDIAFRFSDKNWKHYPLTAATYQQRVEAVDASLINIFLDYESLGEHQEEGVLDFLEDWIGLAQKQGHPFVTPSQVELRADSPVLRQEHVSSWADAERDPSAWLGNDMQRQAANKLYSLRPAVLQAGSTELLTAWRQLSTSDHFYYMSTKGYTDGQVHSYFSPFPTPHDAYVYYMNTLAELELRLGSG